MAVGLDKKDQPDRAMTEGHEFAGPAARVPRMMKQFWGRHFLGAPGWSPTIHRERGFRFVIYFDDHEPAHVDVWHAGAVAKVQIGDADRAPQVLDAGIMRSSELRRAVRIVEANQERFLEEWKKYHEA